MALRKILPGLPHDFVVRLSSYQEKVVFNSLWGNFGLKCGHDSALVDGTLRDLHSEENSVPTLNCNIASDAGWPVRNIDALHFDCPIEIVLVLQGPECRLREDYGKPSSAWD